MSRKERAGATQPTQPSQHIANSSTDENSDCEEFKEIAPDMITMAIFCALREEVVAVKYSLDEEFTCRPRTIGLMKYVYSFGRIGGHMLVIARPNQPGTVKAAQCSETVSQLFPNVRFALLVGIGAGIPKLPTRDIRLGDIAVSIPQENHPGVIQYDSGKYETDGFVLKGSLNKPPDLLISADGSLAEDEMMDRSPLKKLLKTITKRPLFKRPNTSDILFRQDFHHTNKRDNCSDCKTSVENEIVPRDTRKKKDPVVHRGLILSGNGVIKTPQDRDRLCQDHSEAICFEMEAAGIMDVIPCLVIRGICDYADTHKQDGWHHFAAAVAASYCKAILCRIDTQCVKQTSSMSSLLSSMQENQNKIRGTLDDIDWKFELGRLPSSKGAAFDSYENQYSQCLPGTRIELLQQVEQWAISPNEKCIFWLKGIAGTGKSTISQTIATNFHNKRLLGASFFFTSSEETRSNAKLLFPTLVRQLTVSIPQLAPGVRQVIQDDAQISEKPLGIQFYKLLLQPLIGLSLDQTVTMVIVLDALDECERENDIKAILQLLPEVQKVKSVHLRVFLTSKPEALIQSCFRAIEDDHQDMALDEVPNIVVKDDILLFLKHKFQEIRKESFLRGREIPADWPGKYTIQALGTMSVPLFLFAATLCRFVGDKRGSPEKRLAAILEDPATVASSGMERTYLPILNQLIVDQPKSKVARLVQQFQETIGVIILLYSPLSVNAIAQLLGVPPDDLGSWLDQFRSVLSIPHCQDKPVRLLHLSFRDFLLDPGTREDSHFWVDEKRMHETITIKSLYNMRLLKQNICNLPDLGTERTDIDPDCIEHYLGPGLQYACRYWVYHLARSNDPIAQIHDAYLFLYDYLLQWLEAMSLLGIVSEAVKMFDTLGTFAQSEGVLGIEMSEFFRDSKRFALKNKYIAELAPLQLYSSALIFAPRHSSIWKRFKKNLSLSMSILPRIDPTSSAEVATFTGHLGTVGTVIFSPDSRLLASGSDDKTIKLWDLNDGSLQKTLEGHSSKIRSLAFSRNSRLLASCADDQTIKLWNTATGKLCYTFVNHCCFASVVFSNDSRILFSSSYDGAIYIWNADTGEPYQSPLKGHSDAVSTIMTSPEGKILVSASYDKTIKVWDTVTRKLQLSTPFGCLDSSDLILLSSDSRLLASTLGERIQLWDTSTGKRCCTLEDDYSFEVTSLAFSPNSQLLASGYEDQTIKLWDIAKGNILETLRPHSCEPLSLAFSPDGQLLASSFWGTKVKLWDPFACNLSRALYSYVPEPRDRPSELLGTGVLDETDYSPDSYCCTVKILLFSPDGKVLVSRCGCNVMYVWATANGRLLRRINLGSDGLYAAFSPDNRLLAFGDEETIKLLDINTGRLVQSIRGHSVMITSLLFSPTGQLLASGSIDGKINLWNTTIREPHKTLLGDINRVSSMAFSPDGRLLASSTYYEGTVMLWNTTTGNQHLALNVEDFRSHVALIEGGPDPRSDFGLLCFQDNVEKDYNGRIPPLAFSPDGQILASGHGDGKIMLWNTQNGKVHQTLTTEKAARHIDFAKKGPYISTDCGPYEIRPWHETCTTDHLRTACSDISLIGKEWITIGSKKALWLPLEYQAECSAVKSGLVALGHESGRVSFIGFEI